MAQRVLTDAEKAIILAARQKGGKPWFAPRLSMTDAERLAHIDGCSICQDLRDTILSSPTQE